MLPTSRQKSLGRAQLDQHILACRRVAKSQPPRVQEDIAIGLASSRSAAIGLPSGVDLIAI